VPVNPRATRYSPVEAVVLGGVTAGVASKLPPRARCSLALCGICYGSNVKIFFQSFFMLITVQPFFMASSWSACVKVPTLVSGSPWAGP
jgi:hypothetical protein